MKILIALLLSAITLNIAADPNPRVAGGTRVVAQTNGNFTINVENASWTDAMWAFVQLAGKDFRAFGANGDGATDNYAAWTNAMERLSDGDTLLIADGTYVLDTVDVTKDISIIGINGGGFKHKDNATGHMLNWAVEGNGLVKGLTFDANIANQGTNTQYAILYPNGGARGLTITENTFNGFMYGAILDYQTRGKLEVTENAFLNGYKVPLAATNVAIVNAAVWFAPGLANNSPTFILSRNNFTNTPASVSERLPGGAIIFGAEGVSHMNWVEVTHNFFDYVGGDSVGVAHHVGTAAIDWYRHSKGLVGWNVITNAQYYAIKAQQSPDVLVTGNHGHSTGSGVYLWAPGDRDQAEEFRFGIWKDNWAYRGANDTIAFYIYAGTSGLRETVVDGFYAPGFQRSIQVNGFTYTGVPELDSVGPIILRNIHSDATDYVLWLRGIEGLVNIEDFHASSPNGYALLVSTRNTNATINLDKVHVSTENGYAAYVRGVKSVSVKTSTFTETGSGVAAAFVQDGDGVNIGKLTFDRDNTITGTSIFTLADIDSGYAWQIPSTVTHYPAGWTIRLGDGSSTYLQTWQHESTNAVLGTRRLNLTAGGGFIDAWVSDSSTGGISIFSGTYSDATRAGRFSIRAESNASGLDLDAIGSGATIYFRAGSQDIDGIASGTNLFWHGDVYVANEVFSAAWNGKTNAPTKDAIWDAFGTGHTNVAGFALGDMTSALTAGAGKAYWVATYDGTIVGVFGSLMTASGSGGVQYDLNVNGASVLSTKLTIDATEISSITAATNAVISSANFSAGDKFTMDVDVEGSSAAGPQINIAWRRR
jgi:hypothetical protein